jgi:hypothetical protein
VAGDVEFINATRMAAAYTLAIDVSGRELLVVVIKGTFRIPDEPGAAVHLDDVQLPLTMSDEFFGEPGLSAPKYEVDFAARKHRCDVLLNAVAHAPGGRPATRVAVSAQIGSWIKSFDVVGDCSWVSGVTGLRRTPTVPFMSMPITYDRAFGGTDDKHPDPSRHGAFMANPVGRGFHKQTAYEYIDCTPLPNTEESGNPVTAFDGNYRPMSFGPIGRHWHPRAAYAGTYDQRWLDEGFPFLPPDFDERYFQAAPLDQQLPTGIRDQHVTLINLTPNGRCDFVLPRFDAPVHIFPRRGRREDLTAELDTILVEPEARTVALTWRLTRPLKRDVFEVSEVLVGKKGREWWQARDDCGFPVPLHVVPASLA